MGLLGVAAALSGAYVGAQPAASTVALDPDAYIVGGARLVAQGGGVYSGPAGAVVIQHREALLRAGGSTALNGSSSRGMCSLPDTGSRERCQFDIAGRSLAADDQLTWLGWRRRYTDGLEVEIWVQRGNRVPVPFPLGR